jgi:galactokinase
MECESALKKLNTHINAENLCRVSERELELYKNSLTSNEYLRALHAITENQRTIEAAEALKNCDLELFGELMNRSHLSLKDNYNVTGKELDTLALNAQKMDYVCGSRMTGAGFGGAVISLVKKDSIERFKSDLGKIYEQECGLTADFYSVTASDGAGEI